MYNEYYIDKKIQKLLEAFTDLQFEITEAEAKTLNKVLESKDKSKALKEYSSDISKILKKYSNTIDSETARTIKEVQDYLLDYNITTYKEALKQGIITVEPVLTATNKSLIKKSIKNANTILKNVLNSVVINSNRQLDTLIKNSIKDLNNGKSRSQVALDITNKIMQKGIVIKDRKGREYDDIVGYARAVVKDVSNKCYQETQEQLAKEIGIPNSKRMIEVSSHFGARPTHASWQGKIYKYDDFVKRCGLGKIDGIMGRNCRHSYFEFIEGISKPIFEHYNEQENERIYKLQQKQRYNERQIRHWKRKALVKEELGLDTTKEKQKIKEWQSINKKLVDNNTELIRRYDLEKIQ